MIIKLKLTDNELCTLVNVLEIDIIRCSQLNLSKEIIQRDRKLIKKLNKIYMNELFKSFKQKEA